MSDQASTLRALSGDGPSVDTRRSRAIAVTGGKGGVGKSSIAVNLAAAYAVRGASPLMIDADLGMADLNLLLGVAPDYTMLDVLGGLAVEQALVESHGIHLLPALNGSLELEGIDDSSRKRLLGAVEALGDRFDTLVIDVGAGIGRNQNGFATAVPTVVVVATAEALSMADAYACLKALAQTQELRHAYLVPNRVRSPAQADEIAGRLASLVARFLDVSLTPLTAIPNDSGVGAAAERGIPFVLYSPDSPASRAIKLLARQLDGVANAERRRDPSRGFWARFLDSRHRDEGDDR